MTRRKIVVGAWKAYLNPTTGAKPLAEDIVNWVRSRHEPLDFDLVIAPTNLALLTIGEIVKGTAIGLCAQNLDVYENGPYTGRTTRNALEDAGCRYVLLGHSELRYSEPPTPKETLILIRAKLEAALSSNLGPILCIGESEEERRRGRWIAVVERQLTHALSKLSSELVKDGSKLHVAYEPLWALSKHKPAKKPDPLDINNIHSHIREILSRRFGDEIGRNVRVLYGGSVDSSNVSAYLQQDQIDGVLVGSASTNSSSFISLLDAVSTSNLVESTPKISVVH